ncbi:MAG: hypothetical protein WBA12_10440 [Catalinimonas sp.]
MPHRDHAGECLFFAPSAGRVNVSCGDDRGRNVDIYIDVERGTAGERGWTLQE